MGSEMCIRDRSLPRCARQGMACAPLVVPSEHEFRRTSAPLRREAEESQVRMCSLLRHLMHGVAGWTRGGSCACERRWRERGCVNGSRPPKLGASRRRYRLVLAASASVWHVFSLDVLFVIGGSGARSVPRSSGAPSRCEDAGNLGKYTDFVRGRPRPHLTATC